MFVVQRGYQMQLLMFLCVQGVCVYSICSLLYQYAADSACWVHIWARLGLRSLLLLMLTCGVVHIAKG